MRIIESVEYAKRGISVCKSCGLQIKKGYPRIVFDDERFACHKCFEKIINNHQEFLTDYLKRAIPKFKKEMKELKKPILKELILDEIEK